MYNKDKKYTVKYVDKNGKTKTKDITPDKDMSTPEMIMALKEEDKEFFKLIESRNIETERTLHKGDKFQNDVGVVVTIKEVDNEHKVDGEPQVTYEFSNSRDIKCYKMSSVNAMLEQNGYEMVNESKQLKLENNVNSNEVIEKLNQLKSQFKHGYGKDDDSIKKQVKQVLEDTENGIIICKVDTENISGWTSYGGYSETRAVKTKYTKQDDRWIQYNSNPKWGKKIDVDDMMLNVLFNSGSFISEEEIEQEFDKQKQNDVSSHRDIININKDQGISTNRVDYLNKDIKEEKVMEELTANSGTTLYDYIVSKKYEDIDITDVNYDMLVAYSLPDYEPEDNTDMFLIKLAEKLNVVDEGNIAVTVDMSTYVKENFKTLDEIFDISAEDEEDEIEQLVCDIMPSVISGYTTDEVYSKLLKTV